MLKADPYANGAQLRPDTASVVRDLTDFTWTDKAWLEQRKKTDYKKSPMLVYELHLGSWKKPEEESGEEIMDDSVDASVTDSTEDVESAEEAGSEEAAVNPYTKPDFRYP